jgi:hypothetical protein
MPYGFVRKEVALLILGIYARRNGEVSYKPRQFYPHKKIPILLNRKTCGILSQNGPCRVDKTVFFPGFETLAVQPDPSHSADSNV